MTTGNPIANMSQRAILQYLKLTDWKLANRLPIPAGEMILSRLVSQGWIEISRVRRRVIASVAHGNSGSGPPAPPWGQKDRRPPCIRSGPAQSNGAANCRTRQSYVAQRRRAIRKRS